MFTAQRQRVARQRAAVVKRFIAQKSGRGRVRFAAVAQALRRDVQRALCRMRAVKRRVMGGNGEIATALQLCVLLRGDGVTGQRQVTRRDRLAAEIGFTDRIETNIALACSERSLTGGNLLSLYIEAFCAGKRAVLLKLAGIGRQRAVREDFPVGPVAQAVCEVKSGIAARADGALLIERFAFQRQCRRALQHPAVGHGIAVDRHAVALQRAAVCQSGGSGIKTPRGSNLPAVGEAVARYLRVAAGVNLRLARERAAGERDVTFCVKTAIVIQRDGFAVQRLALAAGERTGAGGERTVGSKRHGAVACERCVIQRHIPAAADRQRTAGFMLARERDVVAFRRQVAARQAVFNRQFAAGVKRDIALARIEVAKVNAHPLIAGHQTNAVGVHAAERAGIDRHHWGIAFTGHRGAATVCVNTVRARRHVQIARVDRRVHFGGAGDNRQRVALAGIKPFAFHGDGAAGDLQRGEITCGVEHRLAGGQRDVRRVDKAAAITGNAIRVRHHDVRGFTRHLGVAVEL
ncbi:hypothetical protein BN132_3377 [Cronobacter turicensis 564]|nr:hypothetical protein BN132_3377 [Cronobacter turicensis 564]